MKRSSERIKVHPPVADHLGGKRRATNAQNMHRKVVIVRPSMNNAKLSKGNTKLSTVIASMLIVIARASDVIAKLSTVIARPPDVIAKLLTVIARPPDVIARL